MRSNLYEIELTNSINCVIFICKHELLYVVRKTNCTLCCVALKVLRMFESILYTCTYTPMSECKIKPLSMSHSSCSPLGIHVVVGNLLIFHRSIRHQGQQLHFSPVLPMFHLHIPVLHLHLPALLHPNPLHLANPGWLFFIIIMCYLL